MTDRERLLKILNVPIFPHENVDPLEAVADYLLDNGVTFAKDTNVHSWIPVNEGFPTAHSGCIVYRNNNIGSYYSMVTYTPALGFYYYDSEYGDITLDDVTHWMPLPEPPQEEEDD